MIVIKRLGVMLSRPFSTSIFTMLNVGMSAFTAISICESTFPFSADMRLLSERV